MAKIRDNIVVKGMSGTLNKQLVYKQYSYGTVVTSYPDMSHIVPSVRQAEKRNRFREAVLFAQTILNDPKKRAVYEARLEPGKTVYHMALKEFLNGSSPSVPLSC